MTQHQLSLVFVIGLIGNIVSLLVYLAPAPTFYGVIKKKSTAGFKSLPYLASLFSCMLWIYYAYLKGNAFLLITINTVGCVVETIYIVIYISYAPKKKRIKTLTLLLVFDFGGFSCIALISYFCTHGHLQQTLLGWICLVFSISVFAAPLGIMRQVLRTKSVEFMPFSLSCFLTLNAVIWFFYGLLLKDFFIGLPNIIGIAFGVLQMIIYIIIKNCKPVVTTKIPNDKIDKQGATSLTEGYPVCSLPISDEIKEEKDQKLHEQSNRDETTDAANQV